MSNHHALMRVEVDYAKTPTCSETMNKVHKRSRGLHRPCESAAGRTSRAVMGNPRFSSSTPGRDPVADRCWLPLEPARPAAQSNGWRRGISAGSPSSERRFLVAEKVLASSREQIEPLHCNREWQSLDCELQLSRPNGKQFGRIDRPART